ncbi:hypothetical protein PENSPDRAFT_571202 [Peniophora sp. CONT]|nr:hypothetical protein PENSPDRAFT_571202 [Peniophora sp. CONT]
MEVDDPIVSVLPVHLTNTLLPNIQIHQFPLLNRKLVVPPAAERSGKLIKARLKPQSKRLEIHVPVDTRKDVWNDERAKELGSGRAVDDKEKNQETGAMKLKEGEEPRLSETRLRSEHIPHAGAYMLGFVREGRLHLHPVSETHQLRPTLTYLDVLSRKSKRSRGDDSDSDDGPPPDPDEPAPAPVAKKEKKPTGDARDIQVSARKSEDKGGQNMQGGLSTVRREMLQAIHAEEDETWINYEFKADATEESNEAFDALLSRHEEPLRCKSDITSFLKSTS